MINGKKRVVCFYRVSTKKQMKEDDIPMQRNACKEFISYQRDWEFVKEYAEKGVSGFKVKANKREVLEQLRSDALRNLFDVVLVFMFDRLGRMEEETPYVLKWFIDHGIEMWSVKEGQRVLDNHIDSLLNYITFWQAEGESKKIQQRTLEAKKQMTEAGKFLGCAPAYGYKHISLGEHNEKGREIKKLIIDESEAMVVRNIFDLATLKGYGSRRIAKELNEAGISTKKGKLWSGSTVMGILKNTIYKGYFTYGRNTNTYLDKKYTNQADCKVSSVRYNDLVIISDAQWEEAQYLIQTRAGKVKSNLPRQTKSPLLFTGYSYCKYCGARLTLHYTYPLIRDKVNTNNQDGNQIEDIRYARKPYYICYGKQNGQKHCNSTSYSAEKVEGAVLFIIKQYFDRFEKVDLTNELRNYKQININKLNKAVNNKKDEIVSIEKDIKLLKDEIINILKGESKLSKELIMEQINESFIKLNIEKTELTELEKSFIKRKFKGNEKDGEDKVIPIWKDEFDSLDIDMKKMLLTKLIDKIEMSKEEIIIKFKITREEFFKDRSMNF